MGGGQGLVLFRLQWELEVLPKVKALQGDYSTLIFSVGDLLGSLRGRFTAPGAGHAVARTVGERLRPVKQWLWTAPL